MGEEPGRGAELHLSADVIAAAVAELALLAWDPRLERHAVADPERRDGRADGRDDSGRLVAEREGLSRQDISVPVVVEVVQVGTAEARGFHRNLGIVSTKLR